MTPVRQRRIRPRIDAAAFPALADFARAYLHEDVLAEHGSAVAAAEAFRQEASEAEVSQLAAEIRRLVAGARSWPADAAGPVFNLAFRCAWMPGEIGDLEDLADVLDVRH